MNSDAIVRDYVPSDFSAVEKIHAATQLDYKFPNLSSPLFLVTKVLEVDGKVIAALSGRLELETYLWLAPDWGGPEERLAAIRVLQEEYLDTAWMKGMDNVVCFVPEEVNKHFSKRLKQLGWLPGRPGWYGWSRPTEPKKEA